MRIPTGRSPLVTVPILLVATVALGACGLTGSFSDDASEAASSGGTTSAAPATTSAAAATASPSATSAAPSAEPASGTVVVEPGPGAPVATDPSADGGAPVDVVVAYAEWDAGTSSVEAAGYVSGVVETGGTCTLTLTRGSTVRTASSAGDGDASTTTCGALSIPGSQVPAGTWTAVLSYSSAGAQGTSTAQQVEVPA